MTFCLGMSVAEGLVGIADTRVTSGQECITARKMSVFKPPGGVFFVMTSGLRSVRDKTLTYLQEALDAREEPFSRLFQAANLFVAQLRRVAEEDRKPLEEGGVKFDSHALIGGQMEKDQEHKLYLVYPEGNWVDTGRGTPYHIIGSTGYGKPILDRALTYQDSMRHAFKVGCLAFDSTRISASDVEFPIDVVLCLRDSFKVVEHRYDKDDLLQISNWWQDRMRETVKELPSEWLEQAFSKIVPVTEEQTPAAD